VTRKLVFVGAIPMVALLAPGLANIVILKFDRVSRAREA
jgi:hypothetical protein